MSKCPKLCTTLFWVEKNLRQKEREYFQNLNCKKLPNRVPPILWNLPNGTLCKPLRKFFWTTYFSFCRFLEFIHLLSRVFHTNIFSNAALLFVVVSCCCWALGGFVRVSWQNVSKNRSVAKDRVPPLLLLGAPLFDETQLSKLIFN